MNPFMRSFQNPSSTPGGDATAKSANVNAMGMTRSSFGGINPNADGSQTMKSAYTQFAQTAPYTTPFYLHEDNTNKYKINDKLKKTIADKN